MKLRERLFLEKAVNKHGNKFEYSNIKILELKLKLYVKCMGPFYKHH
jgi:hypothetical protein